MWVRKQCIWPFVTLQGYAGNRLGSTRFPSGAGAHGPWPIIHGYYLYHESCKHSRVKTRALYFDHSGQFIFSLTYHSKITVLTKIYSISSTSLNFLLIKFQWRTYSYDLELNQNFWVAAIAQQVNKLTGSISILFSSFRCS